MNTTKQENSVKNNIDEFVNTLNESEKSTSIRNRVIKARQVQEERFEKEKSVYCNAQMSSKLLKYRNEMVRKLQRKN